MSDQMTFPDTWEEFEKQYGFHDSKQAYMYGNTRLIPSFRVQQWLDHIDDIKRKKQSQKNKMEAIAQLFGKQLGEEFTLIDENRKKYKAVINKNGLRVHGMYKGFWDDTFFKLIIGTAVITDE